MQNKMSSEAVQQLRRARGWKLWLIPKSFDLVTTPLYLSIPLLYAYAFISNGGCSCASPWRIEGMISALMLGLLLIDRLEYWFFGEMTPLYVAIGLLLARALFIEVTALVDSFHFSPILYLVPPFLGTLYFGRRVGGTLAVLAWLIYPIIHSLKYPIWFQQPAEIQYFSIYSVGLVFSVAMAWVFTQEKASRTRAEQVLAELEVSHRQLKRYAAQVEELATAKERNRLARDIHDSLGHYLTVINVQLEKALAFRDKAPGEADQAVGNAKALASEALHEVRRSVSALRSAQEPFSSSAAIQALVERMQGHPQIAVEIEGTEAGFPGESLMALYRAAQEGLTNIQKHAGASQARLELRFDADEATLLLCDDGRGFEPAHLETLSPGRVGAYGLQGVRERLELVGGSLLVESMPGAGTRMLARVPSQRRG
jgi:signal transduction histidine kinase